ncbi:MAG TPA: succinylglutamate desuccinylase/aspartoacylase family protein [Candidatus Peribacteraceae bacterium]|nr:succinylglutamate desuccinylase/aspartoacylase family protein [Candidatus Peribacteraceae bacterium]
MPTLDDLHETYEELAQSHVDGVAGVRLLGDGNGKTVIVSCMTHGNEPCGLAFIRYLLLHPDVAARIRGTLIVSINNLEGARRFFAAATPEERKKARVLDANMNRLPTDAPKSASTAYELQRFAQLYPIFQRAEAGLDLHSFPADGPPMIIDVKGDASAIERVSDPLPVTVWVKGITQHQEGHPIGWFYGGAGSDVPVFEVECGVHLDPAAFDTAVRSGLAYLVGLGMLDLPHATELRMQDVFHVQKSIHFPNLSYELLRLYDNFDVIAEGEIIATGDDGDIVADREYRALFGRRTVRFTQQEEIAFEITWLTDPPVHRQKKQIVFDALDV